MSQSTPLDHTAAPASSQNPAWPEPPERPARPADDGRAACSGAESFALQVLGSSMEPEFAEGEIIIIEPEGLLREGCFVLAQTQDEWIFRQLCKSERGWFLHPLNPAFADVALDDLSSVRGVVIQKAVPGRRRASKSYL